MNNKKKYLIAIIAFVVCSAMFFLAIKAQRMYANNVTNKQVSQSKDEDAKKSAKSTVESKKEVGNETKASDPSKTTDTSKAADKSKDPTKSGEKDANKQTAAVPQENKASSNSENKAASNDSKGSATAETPAPKQSTETPNPNEEPTFVFIDTVHGDKVILQKNVDMEGETVGYITCKLLDEAKIKYKVTGSASTLYFAAIDGLEEKKAGRLSGWCYYVKKKGDTRFHKPNVGTGQWIYNKGDLVVWKYLADGIHDGYSDDWDK